MSRHSAAAAPDVVALLTSLSRRARRLWWVGAATLALGALGTLVAVLAVKRTYRSEAVILYDRGIQNSAIRFQADQESPRAVALRLQDAVMSRKRLEGIIREMKLYPAIVEGRGLVEAIDEMRLHIGFSAREGSTFKVSFDANDRETAQAVANRLCQSLIGEDTKARQEEALATKKLIEDERQRANDDLKAKEKALSEFLAKHPALASEASQSGVAAGSALRAGNRGAHAGEIVSLELQAVQIEQMLSAPSVVDNTVKVNGRETSVDPTLVEAKNRAANALVAARKELTDRQQRFTNEHPDVKVAMGHVTEAEADLRRAEAAIAAAASSPKTAEPVGDVPAVTGPNRADSLKRALSAIRAQIASLSAARPEMKSETGKDVVAVDTEFTKLSRDVAEARERSQQLDSRDFQAQLTATLSEAGRIGRLVVVDPAFRPSRPIAGSRSKVAIAGMAASVVLAFFALLLAAFLDRRVYAAWDVRQIAGPERFVVVIPAWETHEDAEG